jgi:hypothetical protein
LGGRHVVSNEEDGVGKVLQTDTRSGLSWKLERQDLRCLDMIRVGRHIRNFHASQWRL